MEIRNYDVVYHLTEDIERAIKGMYEPTFRQVFEGKAEIKMPIKVPKIGFIAGSQVVEGKITRNSIGKIFRGKEQIGETRISSLRRFKDDVKEVAQGYECGIELDDFQGFQEGDVIESFVLEQENP